jgi:CheY-like chemotaxis protein
VPQSRPPNSKAASESNSRFILIGEDDLDDQEFLKEIFSTIDSSFALLFADNGSQVLTILDKCDDNHLPCLILLDYNMPASNGAEILKELKNNSRYDGIPKIIWSTSGSGTYKDVCLELGANAYLVKPSTVNDLVETCRYMLSACSS